jgi:hypothetical protein
MQRGRVIDCPLLGDGLGASKDEKEQPSWFVARLETMNHKLIS